MADAVTTNAVLTTPSSYVVHLTNISDGTGESAVSKIVKANLLAAPASNGVARAAPTSLDIEWVRWAIQGMTYVKFTWDHTVPDVALALCSSGYEDFTCRGGAVRELMRSGGLLDPRSAGGTGDVKLTTVGAVSGATYDITLGVRLNNQ